MRRVPIEEQIAWMTENEIRGEGEQAEQPAAEVAEPTGEGEEPAEAEAALETGLAAEEKQLPKPQNQPAKLKS